MNSGKLLEQFRLSLSFVKNLKPDYIFVSCNNEGLARVSSDNVDMSTRFEFQNRFSDTPFDMVAVKADKFFSSMKALSKTSLDITLEDDKLVISDDKSSRIRLLIEDDGANLPRNTKLPLHPHGANHLILEGGNLISSIKSIQYAASKQEFQGIFRGVEFVVEDNLLKLTSTDGFRLAHAETSIDEGYIESDFVVPAYLLPKISRLFKGQTVKLALQEAGYKKQLFISSGEFTMVIDCKEDSFLDWKKIVPTEFSTVFHCDRDKLFEAVQFCDKLTEKSSNNRLDVGISDNSLNLFTMEASKYIDIEGTNDKQGKFFGVNSKYLLDVCKALPVGMVVFKATDSSTTPFILHSASNDQDFHMLMPLRN